MNDFLPSRKNLNQFIKDFEIEAEELSIIRQKASSQLEDAIMEQLEQLTYGKSII